MEGFEPVTISIKCSNSDVWQVSEYTTHVGGYDEENDDNNILTW